MLTLLLAGLAQAGPTPAGPDGAGLAAEALLTWAGDAPAVAYVTVLDAEPRKAPRGEVPTTRVMLRIDRVLRDDQSVLGVGDIAEMVLPGADFGGWGVLTSDAPVFIAGDEGLLTLGVVGDAIAPLGGNEAFLPAHGGELTLCVNPSRAALEECADRQVPTLMVPGSASLGPEKALHVLDSHALSTLPL